MSRIIKRLDREVIKKTAERCKERGIIIPTFAQMRDPSLIPNSVKERLIGVGLWDINPVNLFRITWKNDIKTGLFGGVNYFEIPHRITGVKARIIGLVGKFFPTGAHKVGAAFGCLVPRLVSGEFDPTVCRAVWPSTGNYCRGGAFDCALLACKAIAILPQEMSRERFEWLRSIGAEIIATPGCESNVKEIYDKCWELKRDPLNVIFNQFDEFGNSIWHYNVTGPAVFEVYSEIKNRRSRLSAFVSATGSAGTIAAGDFLRTRSPHIKVVAGEALQCPTLLINGFGGHRIEGIGDKHIPWIHNLRNTNNISAIDDEDCMRVLRLFNEPEGKDYLKREGVDEKVVEDLEILGISSISNLLSSIKTAKYYEMNEDDIIFTVFTDSAEMYKSRVNELRMKRGNYTSEQAARDLDSCLLSQKTDNYIELTYQDQRRIHNLKYYTWVEQQGKTYQEILEQWDPEYWRSYFEDEVVDFDEMILEFNREIEKA